jgi:hypothetical protein
MEYSLPTLVCDICEGKLIIGSGGLAVCTSCGMEHSRDRLREKVAENEQGEQTKTEQMLTSHLPSTKQTAQSDNENTENNLLGQAKKSAQTNNYAQTIAITKEIMVSQPTCGEAWLIHGIALYRQNEQTPTTKVLKQVLLRLLVGYRYTAAAQSKKPYDIVEDRFPFAIESLVVQSSLQYKENRLTGSTFVAFINELSELQEIYDTLYVVRSHTDRTYIGNKLIHTLSEKLLQCYATYRDGKYPATFLDDMTESITIALAVIQYCGEAGDPKSAYKSLIDIYERLTNSMWTPTSAMRHLASSIAGQVQQYRQWESHHQAFNEKKFEKRVSFWKTHHIQWCALYLESDRVKKLESALSASTPIEIRNAVKTRINQFAAFSNTDITFSKANEEIFLATIDTLTTDNPAWCERCKQVNQEIAKLNETINAQKWFFGESARIRKDAQRKIEELLNALENR